MAEHGRGAVQVGGREHQHGALGVHGGAPFLVVRAVREGRRVVPAQVLGEKPVAGRETAALGGVRRRQGAAGGAQFGERVVGAVLGQEEIVVVHVAALAIAQGGAGIDVQQGPPARLIGERFKIGGLGPRQ